MPRTYVKKRVKTYLKEDLEKAVNRVKTGESYYSVSKDTNIPYETLRRNCMWQQKSVGAPRVLDDQEEELIVHSMIQLAASGFPLDRKDLKLMVKSYIDNKGEVSRFTDNLPGTDWIQLFEARHAKALSRRKAELLTKARAEGLSNRVITLFFEMYNSILLENGLTDQPHRIFNLDETGLNTDPRCQKVYSAKSSRNSYLLSGTCGKSMYSVLFCCSASGEFLPPFVVYKSLHLYDTWTVGGPEGALYGVSASGWMQDIIFESWLEKFARHVANVQKPCLLTLDGHGSHITYRCAEICKQNEIILLCLPPNTSHALQPLDVGVFGPLKMFWKDILKEWSRETRFKSVTKAVFPGLLKKLVNKINPQWATSGFRGSGLFPPNDKAVRKRAVDTLPQPVATSTPAKKIDHLTSAISSVIAPLVSPETAMAKKNNSASRRRVQAKVGEVLTSKESMERLKEEEIRRNMKKKSTASKKIAPKRPTKEKTTSSTKLNKPKKTRKVSKRILEYSSSSESDCDVVLNDTTDYEDELLEDDVPSTANPVSVPKKTCEEIQIGDVVKMKHGKYKNYIAKVIGRSSANGEYEIHYFERIYEAGTRTQSNCHYELKAHDYDSREDNEMMKIENVYFDDEKLFIFE